jgi:CRP-like cAMP-binding protein
LLSLITDQHNAYDFTALTPVTLQAVPYTQFTDFLKNNSEAAYACLLRMVGGMNGLLQRIENTQSLSASKQVVSLLHYFAKHTTETDKDEHGQTVIPLRLTHQDVADWLGLSRENVSIQLKELERSGVIAKQGNYFVVRDVKRLES